MNKSREEKMKAKFQAKQALNYDRKIRWDGDTAKRDFENLLKKINK